MLLDTRFSWVKSFYLFRRGLGYKVLCLFNNEYYKSHRGFLDGKRLADIIVKRLRFKLDLYKAPHVREGIVRLILFNYLVLDSILKILNKPLFITHDMLT
jgi:hypothetical protein